MNLYPGLKPEAKRKHCKKETFLDRRVGDDRYWQVEGNAICTNLEAPIYITYTKEIEDPKLFSKLFGGLFIHELAIMLGPAIAEATALSDRAERRLKDLKEETS